MAEKIKADKKDNEGLISKAVRVSLSNKRKSPAKTKKRDEVSGGGKKPFRQKGTGRARAGSNRSPLWRGGGVVFGPTGVENHSLSINKKEKAAARKEAMESKNADTVSIAVGKITKTKEAAELLKKSNISGNILVLAENIDLKKYFRNIASLKFVLAGNESTHDILWAKKIVILTGKKETEKK
jgi:large subunit ribosomal protein L4